MKKYPSKISYGLPFFILAVLIGTTIPTIFKPVWIGLLINTVVLLFTLHLFLNTYYVIDGEFLIVKSGMMFNKKVDINSVKNIKETKTIISAPALSFDRLEVNWGKYTGVVISPKDKKRFIDHMTRINPLIDVPIKM
ncbi:MAG: PH domain-containing protein [Maribacter sp.]|nr:PH domain-containing protein [Maribacter sp.]